MQLGITSRSTALHIFVDDDVGVLTKPEKREVQRENPETFEHQATKNLVEVTESPAVNTHMSSRAKDSRELTTSESTDEGIGVSTKVPPVEETDCEHIISVEIFVASGKKPSPPGLLALRITKAVPVIENFAVRRSTTVQELAEMTADRLRCCVDKQVLSFGGRTLWTMTVSGAVQEATPSDTTLGSVSWMRLKGFGVSNGLQLGIIGARRRVMLGTIQTAHMDSKYEIIDSEIPGEASTRETVPAPTASPVNSTNGNSEENTNPERISLPAISTELCSRLGKLSLFSDDNDGSHLIHVKVAQFGQKRDMSASPRVEKFIVWESTALETLAEMTASRLAVRNHEQILCFGNTVLRSFMPGFEETVAPDATLGSASTVPPSSMGEIADSICSLASSAQRTECMWSIDFPKDSKRRETITTPLLFETSFDLTPLYTSA